MGTGPPPRAVRPSLVSRPPGLAAPVGTGWWNVEIYLTIEDARAGAEGRAVRLGDVAVRAEPSHTVRGGRRRRGGRAGYRCRAGPPRLAARGREWPIAAVVRSRTPPARWRGHAGRGRARLRRLAGAGGPVAGSHRDPGPAPSGRGLGPRCRPVPRPRPWRPSHRSGSGVRPGAGRPPGLAPTPRRRRRGGRRGRPVEVGRGPGGGRGPERGPGRRRGGGRPLRAAAGAGGTARSHDAGPAGRVDARPGRVGSDRSCRSRRVRSDPVPPHTLLPGPGPAGRRRAARRGADPAGAEPLRLPLRPPPGADGRVVRPDAGQPPLPAVRRVLAGDGRRELVRPAPPER